MPRELTRSDAWIQTVSGKAFCLTEPTLESISIEDIAHSLAMLCRFNGHTNRFYSVAEHSVYVSNNVTPENALWGLLHDAPEAYIGDLASPVKPLVPGFKDLNKIIENKINEKYGIVLTDEMKADVKNADLRMLITEKNQLMHGNIEWPYYADVQPYDIEIQAYSFQSAKKLFLNRFIELI